MYTAQTEKRRSESSTIFIYFCQTTSFCHFAVFHFFFCAHRLPSNGIKMRHSFFNILLLFAFSPHQFIVLYGEEAVSSQRDDGIVYLFFLHHLASKIIWIWVFPFTRRSHRDADTNFGRRFDRITDARFCRHLLWTRVSSECLLWTFFSMRNVSFPWPEPNKPIVEEKKTNNY